MAKTKKLKGYKTLKEAREIARMLAGKDAYNWPVPIHLESDGSYSVGTPNDKKSVFHIAIDKSGAKYTRGKAPNPYTNKMEIRYIKVK